jgi:hypothetical protein
VLRPAAREVYRVYDEHAFLSGALPAGADSLPVEPAPRRAAGVATVVALLLAAGAACALVALDGPRSQERPLPPRREDARARRRPDRTLAAPVEKRRVRHAASAPRRSAVEPLGARSPAAVIAAARAAAPDQGAAAPGQQTEFGFER